MNLKYLNESSLSKITHSQTKHIAFNKNQRFIAQSGSHCAPYQHDFVHLYLFLFFYLYAILLAYLSYQHMCSYIMSLFFLNILISGWFLLIFQLNVNFKNHYGSTLSSLFFSGHPCVPAVILFTLNLRDLIFLFNFFLLPCQNRGSIWPSWLVSSWCYSSEHSARSWSGTSRLQWY